MRRNVRISILLILFLFPSICLLVVPAKAATVTQENGTGIGDALVVSYAGATIDGQYVASNQYSPITMKITGLALTGDPVPVNTIDHDTWKEVFFQATWGATLSVDYTPDPNTLTNLVTNGVEAGVWDVYFSHPYSPAYPLCKQTVTTQSYSLKSGICQPATSLKLEYTFNIPPNVTLSYGDTSLLFGYLGSNGTESKIIGSPVTGDGVITSNTALSPCVTSLDALGNGMETYKYQSKGFTSWTGVAPAPANLKNPIVLGDPQTSTIQDNFCDISAIEPVESIGDSNFVMIDGTLQPSIVTTSQTATIHDWQGFLLIDGGANGKPAGSGWQYYSPHNEWFCWDECGSSNNHNIDSLVTQISTKSATATWNMTFSMILDTAVQAQKRSNDGNKMDFGNDSGNDLPTDDLDANLSPSSLVSTVTDGIISGDDTTNTTNTIIAVVLVVVAIAVGVYVYKIYFNRKHR